MVQYIIYSYDVPIIVAGLGTLAPRFAHTHSRFRNLSFSLRLAIADASINIKILWCIHIHLINHDQIFVIQLISIWWCVNSGQSTNKIKPHGQPMSYYDAHRNDMCPSHGVVWNMKAMWQRQNKRCTWKVLIKYKTKIKFKFKICN